MDFLLYWGTFGQIAFVCVVFGGGSVAGLCVVRRLVPVDHLQKNHEVAGITFGVLGAFYGLVLAFVIVAAWEQFTAANANSHQEASALESLYKLGAGFAEPMRTRFDSAVSEYTHRVVDEEWPQMANDNYRAQTGRTLKLWSILLSYHAADSREQMLEDKAIDQLNIVGQARNQRILYYDDDLPSVVWLVIYLGCAITIGFSYFFGSHVFRAQVVMCAFFSILLGITILAILELAHPYQGTVTIPDEPFRYALSRMQEVGSYQMAEARTGAPSLPRGGNP
ncbi:MAG: DUF4239 domain-containing protein [Candidatus Binataceae bacterium]